jgi:hypothetical protein
MTAQANHDGNTPTSGQAVTPGDAEFWANDASRLRVGHTPDGALNLNVDGKLVTSPIQGFGKMWQKTYRVRLEGSKASPQEIIRTWKADFPNFWPDGNRFYAPLTGISPGEVGLVNLKLTGRTILSTGVLVLYADDECFTLMTPQGHAFAGWITFSAFDDDGTTVAQAQVLMRAGDPLYELALAIGGHAQENRFWERTLSALADSFGSPSALVETKTVCVDSRRQWRRAGNIWHNAGVRTGIYAVARPFRVRTRRRNPPDTRHGS